MVAKLSKDAFKSQLATAKEKAKQGFNDFEPGQYMFRLTSYVIDKGNNNEERVVGKWNCVEGEEKGKDFLKYFNLEKALAILLQEWRSIGYDTDEMGDSYDEFVKWCKMITKAAPTVIATIYMKKGYPTMRIDEVVQPRDGQDGAGDDAGEPEAAPAPSTAKAPTTAPKAAPSLPAATPPKAAPKAAPATAAAEVADVEDVQDVDDTAPQPVTIDVGTKVAFQWKGADKEGVIDEINETEGKIKVIADNNGKPGRFPITAEMITGVIK